MTTEQCTVDSMLPKNHTESFARQLHNRLRTLNNEIERDGPEDTSWNGDQLSSSSDDIYYDLDSCPSCPGSPAEEATETNYINIKTQESVCPNVSEKKFINRTEYPSQRNGCSINHEYVPQYSLSDSMNFVNGHSSECICVKKSEFLFCEKCKRENYDDTPLSTSTHFTNHNGLSPTNHLYSKEDTDESLTNHFNGFSYFNTPHNSVESEAPINKGIIKDRLQWTNGVETTQSHFLNTNNFDHQPSNHTLNDFQDCYSCSTLQNELNLLGTNSSSTERNNNTTDSIKITTDPKPHATLGTVGMVYTANDSEDMKFNVNGEPKGRHETVNNQVPPDVNVVTVKETFSEDDLCKLVDAVFSKSEENCFDENTTGGVTEDLTSGQCYDNMYLKPEDDDEEETIEVKRSKFRKCSSLKTGKTPPGTPGRKKIVRFADVLGLDLADVRTFLDEIPKVPISAFTDLKNVDLPSSPPISMLDSFMAQAKKASSITTRTIVPLFQQPSARRDFIDRIGDKFVCLENALVTDMSLFVITGVVRVKNIDFHKSVHIRYSIDNWKSFADLQAKYIPNSCDGFSDRFSFVLYAHMLNVGQRLEFAVRYHARGTIFWDNNLGANYTFQCVPEGPSKVLPSQSYSPSHPIETWASFY